MQALLILLICLVTLADPCRPLRRRLPGRIGLVAARPGQEPRPPLASRPRRSGVRTSARDGAGSPPGNHSANRSHQGAMHNQPTGASDAAAHLPRHQGDRAPDPGGDLPWWRCRRAHRGHPPQLRRPPRPSRRAAGARGHGLVHGHAPSGVLGPALGDPPGHRRRRHRGPPRHLPWPPHRAFMGLAPTSRSVAFRQVHIIRFQDGLGIEHWAVPDDLDLARQLGAIPRPPSQPVLADALAQLLSDLHP